MANSFAKTEISNSGNWKYTSNDPFVEVSPVQLPPEGAVRWLNGVFR